MADITMCEGQEGDRVCPVKGKCYRYTAKKADQRQSFFLHLPVLTNDGCKHFESNGK